MHRNTYAVLFLLAVVAALILGVNIGKRMGPRIATPAIATPTPAMINPTEPIPEPEPSGTATPYPTYRLIPYANSACGITLSYPDTVSASESATAIPGVMFTDKRNPDDLIVLTCQKDIPRPPIPENQTEKFTLGSTSGVLYHDSSAKDGTRTDALILTHPRTNLDIFVGGYGPAFDAIIKSLRLR